MTEKMRVGTVEAGPGEKQFGYLTVVERPVTNVVMPVGIINSGRPGPRVVISAGIHGSEYPGIEAAQAAGVPRARILVRHILPNAMSPIIVQATLDLGYIILTAAALSFLGFGAQPGEPDWGRMIADGREFLRDAWWVVTFPGVAILLTVMAFNLVGDAARDIFDPRLHGG